MRKTMATLMMIASASIIYAGDIATSRVEADFTTAAQASNQLSTAIAISGYLQQIELIPSGTYTASVTVAYTPLEGTAVNIYTNAILTSQKILYPAVDRTGVNGADLTDDDPTRYLIDGGTLTITATNVNKTAGTKLRAIFKAEK
jgi:hypothetical protein